MNTLDENLQGLMKFLEQLGQMPPARQIRIVEIDPNTTSDERGRLRVMRSALQTPEAYECRFNELIGAGLPWINMSSLGIEGEFLIVGIETPRGSGSSRTSVNYSGPSVAVLQNGWGVDKALLFE